MAEEPSVDDRQLLHRMRRGDQSAFAVVYECYQGRIFRFALHMTGSRTIAEEITQEVFLLLIRKPAAYDPSKGSLSAYMLEWHEISPAERKGKNPLKLSSTIAMN